jgi:hypothetical protein
MVVEGVIILLLLKYIKNNDMLCENSGDYFEVTMFTITSPDNPVY